jgi:hypothetical protein
MIKVNGTHCIEASVMPRLICVTSSKYTPTRLSELMPDLKQEACESSDSTADSYYL